MSTPAKRAPSRRTPGAIPGAPALAFTDVSRKELWDCITAYYNDTNVDISDEEDRPATMAKTFGQIDYARFNGVERLAVLLLLGSEDWFGAFRVKLPPRHRSRELAVRAIAGELRRHRPEFCAAVKWLCTEKPETDIVAQFNKGLFGLGEWDATRTSIGPAKSSSAILKNTGYGM